MTRPALRCSGHSWFTGLTLAISVAWLGPAVALAQGTNDPPAHISLVEGAVVLERDGRTEPAPSSMPLLAGDRLRTQSGRVEVLFADNSTLHLDSNSLLDFQSDDVIRLLDGRLRLNIPGPDRPVSYRIDAPAAWVQISRPGEYRVSVGIVRRGEIELAVLRGSAELVNEDGTTALRAGERAFASAGTVPSSPYVVNSAAWDDFDRWSEERRNQRLGLSSQYLPADVRPYASTFDDYGAWRYEPVYGYVWYPRVKYGWRPYYHGRWSHFRPWGWTWIGYDPWAWPTHHYGRWGFSAGAWFWIPGRTWGPAWVSWGYAPGYVSWCPLGWNNFPVFSFVSVNVFGGKHYQPWHGWTVVPHRSFQRGFVNVGINVVTANTIAVHTRRAFTTLDRGPDYRGFAVPRDSTPIRVAGTGNLAGSRSGSLGAVAPSVTPRNVPNRSDSSFRSRGSTGAQLSGPGFPAPAREPRAATPAVPNGRRQGPTAAEPSAASAAPGGTESERRAVPRGSGGVAAPTQESQPSRRAVPSSGRPSVTPRGRGQTGVDAAPGLPRAPAGAVPRSQGYVPPPTRVPDRGSEGSTPQPDAWRAPRAVPRSAEPSQPPAYRSYPGVERRAPSAPAGPPPSMGPAQRSGPPHRSGSSPSAGPPSRGEAPSRGGGGGAGANARPRGGQPSRGTAVRRGGG